MRDRIVSIVVQVILLCSGTAKAEILFSDNFDPINSSQWTLTSTVGARGAGQAGFDFGNALHFAGYGTRSATTVPLDLTTGETIEFDFRGGNEDIDGSLYWEDVDLGEDAVLEYSTDGTNFTVLDTLDLFQFRDDSPTTTWLKYTATIPAAARTTATQFRWRQLSHNGWRWDEWGIDNVVILSNSPEPSAWVLFAITGIVFVFRRTRRTTSAGATSCG